VSWQELPALLEVDAEERADRLERRLDSVLRQLEWRIAEVDGLRAELQREQRARRRAEQAGPGAYVFVLPAALSETLRRGQQKLVVLKASPRLQIPRAMYRRLRPRGPA
jgi:dephospho-CoA kinase